MTTKIVELSTVIAEKTKVVDEYFKKNGLATPSFDLDGPTRIAIPPQEKEASDALTAVLSATRDLNQLLTGPTGVLMGTSPNDCLSLQAVYRFKIAQALPVGEEWSFEDLSKKVGLNVIDLRRLVRHAMCNHIFREPRTDYVAHTATSKLLAESELMQNFVGITMEEKFRASGRVVDALQKYDGAHSPEQSGFSLAFDTPRGFYDEMEAHPERGRRFASAMNTFASLIPLEPLFNAFDWASFGKATVVDVGGAWGPVSIGLAQRFPDLNFIVQDLAGVVDEGPSRVPAEIKDRFQFMPYSILDEQPVKGAPIYFFRAIFHNWPDESCVQILKNQIPALKKGARIVIDDSTLHEPNTLPSSVEKRRRSMDLSMLTWFGSRERTVDDWEKIFKAASPSFQLRHAKPAGMNYNLDVEWTG
ncbi:hypothetical protein M409DRAFT_68527 [Zasmidium cellare ATCC 36951]|uniref:O-methyltransferase C-terminal domain-containing protein n=1 Tax=Zasmidium cellare ATCC 36951 TaxID=1080233 RepID=A0A6A6C854_ZASCE|nr:uncharacterized protein M409DRAFT_68527 [Zasmidium cellare ATCC 36951]KAF2163211.1 hypothetical protein M409DRAFT_68527 [Zasmidium cellare ATCC 36951]